MRSIRRVGGPLAVAALAVGLMLAAPSVQAEGVKKKLTGSSKEYLSNAYASNLAQIKLSQVALHKEVSRSVKSFAQSNIDRKRTENKQLSNLARKKGVELPSRPPEEAMTRVQNISHFDGKDFEQAYLREMVKQQADALNATRQQASSGNDNDVRDWATKRLPTERRSLNNTREIAERHGVSGVG